LAGGGAKLTSRSRRMRASAARKSPKSAMATRRGLSGWK
jgi:hypothetical protein